MLLSANELDVHILPRLDRRVASEMYSVPPVELQARHVRFFRGQVTETGKML